MEINSSKVNVIAFYLPQFHTIPENDDAYGKGFTEWTNVKKAKPLFEGHRQPRVPLNDNYYCLLDNGKTMKDQAKLAQDNGVFGFCYYHYYFKNGKKLLEKPLEEMLENKDIDIPFCMCWANENWSKRWDGGNNEVIVEQNYDDLEGIEEHVKYLSKFLADPRYITVNGAPLLLIYKPDLIPNVKQYVSRIRECFKKNGFEKVFIASQFPTYYLNKKHLEIFDYYVQFEPMFTDYRVKANTHPFRQFLKRVAIKLHLYKTIKKAQKKPTSLTHMNYDEQWQNNLNFKVNDKRLIAGAFADWDNTARNKNGTVYDGVTVEKFASYFDSLTQKVKKDYSLPMIFINAWNEWAEGTYLEPDTDHEYGYLKAIKHAIEKQEII